MSRILHFRILMISEIWSIPALKGAHYLAKTYLEVWKMTAFQIRAEKVRSGNVPFR